MALVTDIHPVEKERTQVHDPVECSFAIVRVNGETYLQLETYGSPDRKERGKISQSIQFNSRSAAQLKALLDQVFG